MLDLYFKRPLVWDYSISIILIVIFYSLNFKGYVSIPNENYLVGIISDLSNISLTSAGFILTLLTVLITFKSSNNFKNQSLEDFENTFDLFFASNLYFETVRHLKNCIKSLIFVALLGYVFKLIMFKIQEIALFLYCILGLIILILSLWRCLLILSRILNMQKNIYDQNNEL